MDLIVKATSVEIVIDNCRKYIDQIDREINNMISNKEKLIWSGQSSEKAILKYNLKIEELRKMVKSLSLYIDIFDLVVKNYGISQDDIIKKLNELREDYYGKS